MRQVQRAALCLPRLCHSARGGTLLRQGPDHPPCLPLAPAQRTPCSRVPSPPSKHTACLSLILLLAPGLCPPRRPLHARGSLDTAHFTLTLASLPLGVVSWGGEDSLADPKCSLVGTMSCPVLHRGRLVLRGPVPGRNSITVC